MAENPNSAKLIELNRYVITTDSQDDSSDDINHGSYPHPVYIKATGEKELANVMGYSFQRPYIDFIADNKTSQKMGKVLASSSDVGLICVNIKTQDISYTNPTFDKLDDGGRNPIVVTMSNFKDIGRVLNETMIDETGIRRGATHIKEVLGDKYDISFCIAVYIDWANSKGKYYLPKGFKQSNKANPTEYLLNVLIQAAKGISTKTAPRKKQAPKPQSLPKLIKPVFAPTLIGKEPIKWPEGQTINEKRYGLWVNYDQDGLLEEAGNYMNGIKVGAWTTYNEDGTINSSGIYRNDMRDGPWVLFYHDGMVNAEGMMKDDRQSGKWKVYYPGGQFKKYVDFP